MPDKPDSAFAPSEFPAGTIVRLKKEHCEPGEEMDDYKIVDDRGDRVLIETIMWTHGPIVPQELVSAYMVRNATLDEISAALCHVDTTHANFPLLWTALCKLRDGPLT